MPDLNKIIESIERTLKWIFPEGTPPWLLKGIGYIIGFVLLLLGLWGLLYVLSKIKKLWIEEFWPLFYKKELKKRRARRQRFADHIEGEIRRLNTMEAWSDFRFAELEAEVEAEGRRRSTFSISFFHKIRTGIRREASLSNALKQSQERLIILEGDPGAGKSVALRHVAKDVAAKAFRSRRINSPIPLYINLKALERSKGTPIDLNLIKSFILESLNRANDIDISRFLDEEFDRGLKDGTWLFLFDSFDELPEILSATETDSVISSYTDAISDFLHGFNLCRGIIASRQFRGPKQFGWPRFRILPLSEERRLKLIRRADLDPQIESDLIGHLELARNEIYAMASNPMFLSLLCEHMRTGRPFPVNAHGVFETYVGLRLTRDKDRVRVRFGVEANEVRAMAEVIAFCMAADTELSLTATRQSIREAAIRLHITIEEQFHPILDALEYIKLARSEDSSSPSNDLRTFTFAHRRFQEYFATSVVLREPERVSPQQLLHDARWRETAVVMCQTQDMAQLQPLLQEVNFSLNRMVDNIRENIDIPKNLLDQNKSQDRTDNEFILSKSFPWPDDALHILSLLQDGFISRTRELPDDIRTKAGLLIVAADRFGTLIDKKWALEIAGIIPQLNLLSLLREAFSSHSQWLQDNAYRQAAHLSEVPSDIAKWIRRTLVYMALQGNLWRQRHSVRTFLSRLENPTTFTSALRLILLTWLVDLSLLIILVFCLIGGLIRLPPISISLGAGISEINRLQIFTIIFISWGGFWWFFKVRLFTVLFKTRMLFFSTYLRMIAPCTAVFTLIISMKKIGAATPDLLGMYVSTTIVLLLFTWAPSALYCAEKGKFTNPIWWPVLSFVGIGGFF